MKKRTFKFGIIDLLIVVFVIAALVGAYVFLNNGDANDKDSKKLESVDVYFTVELKTQPEELKDIVKVGDKVIDSIKGGELGKVVKVEPKKATNIMENQDEGTFANAEYDDLYDVYVTIKGKPTSIKKDIMVSGQVIKVGRTAYFKNKNYAYSGFIVEMDVKK